jgi:hypothetical protein
MTHNKVDKAVLHRHTRNSIREQLNEFTPYTWNEREQRAYRKTVNYMYKYNLPPDIKEPGSPSEHIERNREYEAESRELGRQAEKARRRKKYKPTEMKIKAKISKRKRAVKRKQALKKPMSKSKGKEEL